MSKQSVKASQDAMDMQKITLIWDVSKSVGASGTKFERI